MQTCICIAVLYLLLIEAVLNIVLKPITGLDITGLFLAE